MYQQGIDLPDFAASRCSTTEAAALRSRPTTSSTSRSVGGSVSPWWSTRPHGGRTWTGAPASATTRSGSPLSTGAPSSTSERWRATVPVVRWSTSSTAWWARPATATSSVRPCRHPRQRRATALQARAFAEAGAAMMTAVTMTYVDEAIGITRAAGSNADLDVHDGLPPEVVEELVDVIFDGLPPNARRIAERASVLRRVTEPLLAAVLSDNASRGTCAHPASTRAQMRSPTKSSASHCWTSTRRDPAGNRSHGDVEPARGARHWRPAGSPTGARRASRGRPPTPPS